ncbi:MAG: hypothetical protein JHC95_16035 [Solirubrobacteraceae bacterium]|nr:hypothetical protein [Solirubrobacteraceae bacterium]
MSRYPRTFRSLAATTVAAALVVGFAPTALAAQTKLVVDDPVEPGKAYDIVKLVLKSQKTETTNAKVVVKHGREVEVGDSIDVWFNIDTDAEPDVHLVGDSFSEYTVFETTSFDADDDGKDISRRGCMDLKMTGFKSIVRFDPKCLKAGAKFAVSVKTSRTDKPAGKADYVPAPETFTKKVLSGPLA